MSRCHVTSQGACTRRRDVETSRDLRCCVAPRPALALLLLLGLLECIIEEPCIEYYQALLLQPLPNESEAFAFEGSCVVCVRMLLQKTSRVMQKQVTIGQITPKAFPRRTNAFIQPLVERCIK